jgi:hypothetical protein
LGLIGFALMEGWLTMDDLISRNAALEAVKRHYPTANEMVVGIIRVPAADAVEVVRCKECQEYDTTGYDDMPEFGWCKCLRKDVQSCFYCAHGEIKDNRIK